MPTVINGTSITAGAIDLTTPLSVLDGGTGISSARGIAQIVTFQTGAFATGTRVIPFDNTIPQITEGDQYMSLAITPNNSNSTLEVDITFICSSSVSGANGFIISLFQDATANALASLFHNGTNGVSNVFTFKHIILAGTVLPITFKVRAGGGGAGTTNFNSNSLGGTLASRITIKEYLP